MSDDEDDEAGFSLSLPPIHLPPLFPENFRVLWPTGPSPERAASPTTVAAAAVAFDLVDAALALTVDAPVVTAVRTVGGALVAAGTFGLLGAAYVIEPVAALLGYGALTAFPTLSVLLLARLLR